MARRMRPETAVAVHGIRGLQAACFRARLDRLIGADSVVYDFSAERDQLARRIAALEVGEAVSLQAWELAGELVAVAGLKSRFDQSGPKCFRIEGDALMPEHYERIVPNGATETAELGGL